MAREGILVGFPQQENAGEIATRVTAHNVTQANQVMQQGKTNARADERQGWDRQMQPYRLQSAADEQQMNQMKLDEVADTVKRTSAARAEWEGLSKRFGTDDEPTYEEIMIAHANMAVARRDPGAASSAINALAQMKQGDERGKDLQGLAVKTAPLLGQLHTPEGLEKLSKALDEYPKAISTPTYQTLWKSLLQGYEKVYPPQAAEAMQEWRLARSQGKDPRMAWNAALSTRPEAERYFAIKGNLPEEVKSYLHQEDIKGRQGEMIDKREGGRRETALQVEEARAKRVKETEQARQAARREMVTLHAKLRQSGSKNDLKEAAAVTNQSLTRTQRAIADLTKQLEKAKDEDLEGIQERLEIQYELQGKLQDTLNKIGEASTAKAGVAPPEGGTPKVTPEAGAPKPADKKKVGEAGKKIQATVKGLSGDKLKTKLQSILQAAIENQELSEEQAKSIYLETMRASTKK